jgi:hypothetical protein
MDRESSFLSRGQEGNLFEKGHLLRFSRDFLVLCIKAKERT